MILGLMTMIKKALLTCLAFSALTACTTFSNYSKPSNLLFQKNVEDAVQILVQRDKKLCQDEQEKQQNCPIHFYINDFKSGDFYIQNEAKYYLKPNEYKLTVKNCKNKCTTSEIQVKVAEDMLDKRFILTLDDNDKPLIIQKTPR